MATFKCTTNIYEEQDGKKVKVDSFEDEEYSYDFGETVQDLISKFGEAAVFSAATGAMTVSIQTMVRSRRASGFTQEQVQEQVNSWMPGQRSSVQVDPQQALLARWGSMSDAEKKEFMKKLQSAA